MLYGLLFKLNYRCGIKNIFSLTCTPVRFNSRLPFTKLIVFTHIDNNYLYILRCGLSGLCFVVRHYYYIFFPCIEYTCMQCSFQIKNNISQPKNFSLVKIHLIRRVSFRSVPHVCNVNVVHFAGEVCGLFTAFWNFGLPPVVWWLSSDVEKTRSKRQVHHIQSTVKGKSTVHITVLYYYNNGIDYA